MEKEEIILQVGVKLLIKNSEGKYLLMRSNPDKYPEKGAKWDIVGGRIHPGTTLLDNLKREVMEESGLAIEGEPRLVAAQDILRVPNRHVVRLTYVGSAQGEPRIDEESLEYRWFEPEVIKLLTEDQLDVYFRELIQKGIVDI